jgi:hypothetical protein
MKAKPQATLVTTGVTEIPTVRAVVLEVSNLQDSNDTFALAHSGDEVTFGRSENCTVPFRHNDFCDVVSGLHCTLYADFKRKSWTLQDENSTNGTFQSGESTFTIGGNFDVTVELYEGPMTLELLLLLQSTSSLNSKPVKLLLGAPELLVQETLKPQVKLLTYTPLTADKQEGGETVNIKSSDMDDFNNSKEIAMKLTESDKLLEHIQAQMQAQKQMQARYAELFGTTTLLYTLVGNPGDNFLEFNERLEDFFSKQRQLVADRKEFSSWRRDALATSRAALKNIKEMLGVIQADFEILNSRGFAEYTEAKVWLAQNKQASDREKDIRKGTMRAFLSSIGKTYQAFEESLAALKARQKKLKRQKEAILARKQDIEVASEAEYANYRSQILAGAKLGEFRQIARALFSSMAAQEAWLEFKHSRPLLDEVASKCFDALLSEDSQGIVEAYLEWSELLKSLSSSLKEMLDNAESAYERRVIKELRHLFYEEKELSWEKLGGDSYDQVHEIARKLQVWNLGLAGMGKTKSLLSKKHFEKQFKRATNACLSAIAEIRNEGVRDQLLKQVTGKTIAEVTRASVQQMRLRLRTAGSAYQAMRAIKLKLHRAANGLLCVDFSEGAQGRIETGAQPIQKILDDPSFLSQIVVWEYDTSSIKSEKDADEVWEAVANVCRPEKFLPVANNGSRALIKLVGDDGELSTVAKFMDALFENFSQVGAYGLSLLNAAPESAVSEANETRINNGPDSDGRKTTVILYDANALGWMPGVDGAALSSVGSSFQHRSFTMKFDDEGKPRFELGAAFFKGLQADSRICMRDSKPWSVSDLINLGKLTEEEFKYRFGFDKTDENIESVMQDFGHFNLPNATNSKEYWARTQRWDEWFNANPELDRVYGLEVGMLKGKGKKGMAKLVDSLVDKQYQAKDANANPVTKTIKEASSIKDILKATGGWFEIDCPVYGWSIIDSPEKSSTSMNYQPQSVLIYTEDGLARLKQSYNSKTDEFIERFSARAMEERDSSRYHRLGDLMAQVLGGKLDKAKNLTVWPEAVVKNPVGSFYRWCFNFDKTNTPTKRVVMVDHGEYSYTGLMLVDDALLRRESAKQAKNQGERLLPRLVRGCTWRGPLIVPGAAQAPWLISGKVAAWLLDELEKKNAGKQISEHAEKQLQIIVDRIAFKRDTYGSNAGWTKDKVWSLLEGILKNIVNDASLVKMGNELVIMDRRDVEAMQGDDDGDTVVVETDPDTVQRFVDAENFWKKFYKANGLRPLQIEMSKDNQIDFALANSVYSGGSYNQLSAKAKTLIDVFGVDCSKIAEYFGLPSSKIPSPLGLNFALIHKIDEQTNGGVWRNLARFGFKLGSTPTGPIGAFANEGPDFLVRALKETGDDLVLTEYGKRLWQGYALASSGLQVSIDWAKRVYQIVNAALYDLRDKSGRFVIDFEKELTPDAIKDVLVSSTWSEVKIVRFKYDVHDGKTNKNKDKWVKDGHKLVRVVIVDESCDWRTKPDASGDKAIGTINNLDTTLIHYWTEDEFKILTKGSGAFKVGDKTIRVGDSTKVTNVNLMDMGNGCFDFDSVFALGSFMLQRPMKQGHIPGEFEENVAAWKVDIAELLGKKRGEALGALNKSYHRSSLTAHVTQFLEYTEDNHSIKQMLGVMPQCATLASGEDARGLWLDRCWNDVRINTAAFFDAIGGSDRGEMDKNSVVRAALKAFGVPGKIMDDFLQGKATFMFKLNDNQSQETCLADVVACLMRNDKKYEDEKVPQNLTQMVIGEYLDRSEPNPFMQICTEAADHFMDVVYGAIGDDFTSTRQGKEVKSSLSFYKSFNKFLNAGRVNALVPESERDGFANRFLNCKECQSASGENYLHFAWKSSRDLWLGMAEIVDYRKQALLGDGQLWATLQSLYATSLVATYSPDLAELDFAGVQRQFESATRLMIASYDQAIRTFRAYANERSVVPELFEGSKRSKLAGIYSKDPVLAEEDLNSRNFLGSGMSIKRRLDAMTQNRSVTRLPEAQANRETQQEIIHNLVQGGCLVKSWSYFADSTWRGEFEVRMFYLADTHEQRLNEDGSFVFDKNALGPVRCFVRQNTILRMAGKPVEKYLALNGRDAMYQGAKEYFTAINVGDSKYLVWDSNEGPSRLATAMIAENILLEAIKYLQSPEQNKKYGKWNDNPPANCGLTISKGGSAINYDGKDYFYEDALITKLLKKVRFSK